MFNLRLSPKLLKIGISGILSLILIVFFQNCNQIKNKKNLDQNELSSTSAVEIAVPIEDHPIEVKEYKTTFTLQLSDRNYIASVLSDVFGPDSSTSINTLILNRHNELGGPCSLYAQYKVLNDKGTPIDQDSRKFCDLFRIKAPLIAPPQTTRQGLINQVCSSLSENTKTFEYALDRIQPKSVRKGLMPEVNQYSLANLHRLFYRERPLPTSEVFQSLEALFDKESPTADQWRTAIFSYCISSHWQVI